MKKLMSFRGFCILVALVIFLVGFVGVVNYFGQIAPSNQAFFDRHEIFSLPYSITEIFIGILMFAQSIIIGQYQKRDEYDILNPMNEKPWDKYGREEP